MKLEISPYGVHPDFEKLINGLSKLSNIEVEKLLESKDELENERGIFEAKRRGMQIINP